MAEASGITALTSSSFPDTSIAETIASISISDTPPNNADVDVDVEVVPTVMTDQDPGPTVPVPKHSQLLEPANDVEVHFLNEADKLNPLYRGISTFEDLGMLIVSNDKRA